ncbi:hypothetical protein [Mycolicibacterium brisbanense]|nr:hypothetical protein [Mycolicibacterium brisbanense]MCV7158001.1 hypothetical protein [Mycolicibacterium brisbanense]
MTAVLNVATLVIALALALFGAWRAVVDHRGSKPKPVQPPTGGESH